jgi:hypothetical protein
LETSLATARYFSPFGASIYAKGFLYKGFYETTSISAFGTSQVMTNPFVNTPISYYQEIPITYILIVDYTTAYLAKQTNRGILKQGVSLLAIFQLAQLLITNMKESLLGKLFIKF